MSEVVRVDEMSPAIAAVTLYRPKKRNALSVELLQQLADAITSASQRADHRVLIVRGAGPVFCAGLDLLEAENPANAEHSARALAKVYLAIARSPLIVIASAHGAAMGGGAGLLAACDLAVAADDLRVGFPEVHRGLVAALVTALLRRQLGDRHVRDLVLLGRTIDAATAKSLGLVQNIVPVEKLSDATMELARQACEGAPMAIARSKRLLDGLAARPLEEDIERALHDHLESRTSAEAIEGIAAFREKRKPIWPRRT